MAINQIYINLDYLFSLRQLRQLLNYFKLNLPNFVIASKYAFAILRCLVMYSINILKFVESTHKDILDQEASCGNYKTFFLAI